MDITNIDSWSLRQGAGTIFRNEAETVNHAGKELRHLRDNRFTACIGFCHMSDQDYLREPFSC